MAAYAALQKGLKKVLPLPGQLVQTSINRSLLRKASVEIREKLGDEDVLDPPFDEDGMSLPEDTEPHTRRKRPSIIESVSSSIEVDVKSRELKDLPWISQVAKAEGQVIEAAARMEQDAARELSNVISPPTLPP